MNIKGFVINSVLVVIAMLGINEAYAVCSTYGQVEQYWTNGTTCYAYVSPATSLHPHPYYYYFSSTDPELCDAIFNAKHQTGYISGNATSCPTTGSLRYGGVASGIYAH
ncbi:hypothetical protein [Methylomagnum ishizawai]|uniref:hypothetical protein n=1 Tax=Methylomagnum ishizawai TaxID=1760988 RepID=UPI001C32A5BB|nr:hypothetical protein [Methylomagnum ishizawai]BBL75028.1 hypothetical protein MishRS11D_21260 [Methylomagnum ishizawai]